MFFCRFDVSGNYLLITAKHFIPDGPASWRRGMPPSASLCMRLFDGSKKEAVKTKGNKEVCLNLYAWARVLLVLLLGSDGQQITGKLHTFCRFCVPALSEFLLCPG